MLLDFSESKMSNGKIDVSQLMAPTVTDVTELEKVGKNKLTAAENL